jgi:hypothetical protein
MTPRDGLKETEMMKEIEKIINLLHPYIAAPIGFVLPIEPESL